MRTICDLAKATAVTLTVVTMAACSSTDWQDAEPDAQRLERVVANFIGETPASRSDYSAAAFLAEIESQRDQVATLERISNKALTAEQSIDHRLLLGIARAELSTFETRRLWENDPTLYVRARQLGALLAPGSDATANRSMDDLLSPLVVLPERLAHARRNLRRPPKRFTEAAIYQVTNLLASLESAQSSFDIGELEPVWRAARNALDDYLSFLQQELLPRSDGSWALGQAAYDTILRERWHMDTDANQILARGWQAFRETEALAQTVAERIRPGEHWTVTYESLKDQHPAIDDIKSAYQQQMDLARDFVIARGIVTLPDGERVTTIDTPPAMRRSSPFGTFQTANRFDDSLEGQLILTPIDKGLADEQRRERLRSHHDAWIPVIAVHEAYPGHHAQALKVKENPNLLRRVIRESIFSEGWGLYTEEMMYQQGFLHGDDVRLTQLRNRLWRAARVILDASLHTGQMNFDEAVDFLVERVRFERYSAELEVGMYTRRPTYVLGYLIGMQEIQSIRADYVEQFGEPDPPSVFYDDLLRAGALPPALLREVLFGAE